AYTHGSNRVGVHGPVDHVEVVNMLLDDMITAKPGEVIPIAHLVFHIAPFGPAFFHPARTLIPVSPRRHDLTHRAIMNLLKGLQISGAVVAVSAGSNKKSLRFGFFVNRKAGSNAGAVNGYGFLGEDILPSGHGRLQVSRSESRRNGQNHVVNIAAQN